MAGIPFRAAFEHIRRLHDASDAAQRSDRELLRAFAANNDQDAFAVIVTRHAPLVWGVCQRILGHQEDAEDAFQATFLILARRADSARWQPSVGGWLYTVAHRLAVRARKRTERRRACEREASRMPRAESSLRELAAVVDEELRRLPAKYRDPLLLHYLEGATAEAAARQLGLSRCAFYNRLSRGRELLRGRLSRQGLSMAAPLLAAALSHKAEAAAPSLIQAVLRGATASAPPRVAALALEAARNTLVTKLKIGLALGVLLGVAAGGIAMLTPRTPLSPIPQAERPADQPKVDDKPARRVDRDGDPLPEGAVARLGTRRWRACGEVEALTFTPDGKTVLSVSPRGAPPTNGLCLFDAANGKLLKAIRPPGTFFGRIAFSTDGKRLAAACTLWPDDNRRKTVVQIRELPSGRKLQEFAAENLPWLGWSADGQPLAAYSGKGEIRLREMETGRERRFAAKDLPRSTPCAVGKNVLAAFDEKGLVHVWDLSNGEEQCVLKSGGPYTHSLALSPNGRWLASLTQDAAGTYFARVWDTATGVARHRVAADQKYLAAVAFAPDGKTLATAGWWEVRFWDVATGRERGRTKSGGQSFGPAMAFSPDGKTLATTERYSGTIHLWDVPSGTRKAEPESHTNRPNHSSFSPDGKRVVTSSEMDETILIWNLATGEPLVHIQRGRGMGDCAFSADGRTLYSCGDDKLYVNDTATGRELHVLKGEDLDRPKARESGLGLHLSDDRDVATCKQFFHRRRGRNAVSPDARMLAAANAGAGGKGKVMGAGTMYLEDLASGERLLTFPRFEGQRWPLLFSPDGRLLLSYNNSHTPGKPGSTLGLWEVLTASELLTLPATDGNDKAAFSADGRLLAVTAPSGEVLLWDLRRGKELHRFKGFDAQVTSLTFSPDGSRLVSGLSDSTLLVWEVATVRSKDRPATLDAASGRRAWDDLAAEARKAFAARQRLASAAEQTVSQLRERLRPAQAPDRARLRRLLADLDSDQFAVREKARRELAELGELAEPALRQALADKPALEVRRRIQALLDDLRAPVTRPELLQSLRAVAVLEDIGTGEARRLLKSLADGAPAARLTREAKSSLERLSRRPAPTP